MKSSAKTTAVSFLAAAALGAAAFLGCSVESGTVDDTDGGTQNNDKDSGKTDSGTTDSGGETVSTCTDKQKGVFVSETCQACLDTKCCSELTACYTIPSDEATGKVDCNDYDSCIDECSTKGDDQLEACYQDCDDVAATGVQDAYEAIETCGTTNCATECGVEAPDGG
jgi:hypothetical protein